MVRPAYASRKPSRTPREWTRPAESCTFQSCDPDLRCAAQRYRREHFALAITEDPHQCLGFVTCPAGRGSERECWRS